MKMLCFDCDKFHISRSLLPSAKSEIARIIKNSGLFFVSFIARATALPSISKPHKLFQISWYFSTIFTSFILSPLEMIAFPIQILDSPGFGLRTLI